MKRAVITGPTGAIGVALIEILVQNQIEVLAICRNGSRRMGNIPKHPLVKIVECDLEHLSEIRAEAYAPCEVFYHFGWDGTFGDSRNNMEGQLDNIRAALEAVDLAKYLGCHTFVGAGSQAEYGRVEGKLTAQTPAFPENGYGMAKLCAGQMTRIKCRKLGIRHIWTRVLSVYGPYDGAYTMVMSTIEKLIKGQKPAFTRGEQKWDYLYSKDAGQAFYLLGEKGVDGRIYCIGSGKAQPLAMYIDCIRNEIDPHAELGLGEIPYQDKQVMYLCADIEDLQKDTGFCPSYSFEKGIQETIAWCKGRLQDE